MRVMLRLHEIRTPPLIQPHTVWPLFVAGRALGPRPVLNGWKPYARRPNKQNQKRESGSKIGLGVPNVDD
jgi:hypothetical protein